MMDVQKNLFLEIFHAIDFQKIKDHPNILIAAAFWEKERFQAARVCYQSMRIIDDLIDDYKAEHQTIRPEDREKFKTSVNEWLALCLSSSGETGFHKELTETFEKFMIPLWTMQDFAKSMIYDIDHEGFPTFDAYLEYSQGASVAPASVFVHLAGLTRQENQYKAPAFDVKEAATPCAIFSYIVHIIRDFQKDQLNHLNYFPEDLLLKNGLSLQDLKRIAGGEPVNASFRHLIRDLYERANEYRLKTLQVIERISPLMEPRYRLSMEIIFSLYTMIFEKIDPENGQFTSAALNATPEETRERVLKIIREFD